MKENPVPGFRIGVAGCGYWGPNIIRNLYHNPRVERVHVCDLRQDRLSHIKSLYRDVEVEPDFDEMISRPLDGVVVATPPHTHFPLAMKVLESGKALLVEKPMTQDVGQAERVVEEAGKRGLLLMVGHTFLYNESVIALKGLIEGDELGKLLYLYSIRVNLGIFQERTDVIWDLTSHDLSIFNFLCGEGPYEVSAASMANIKDGIWDVAFLTFYYRGGVVAHSHVSWVDPVKIRRITVVGDKEMAVYDDMNIEEPLKIYKRRIRDWPYYDTFGEFKMLGISGDIQSPFIPRKEPLKSECEEFLDCLEKGGAPRSSGDKGLLVVKGIAASRESVRRGGERVKTG